MPQPGDTFGRYEIRRRIGRGGMGIVFAARQTDLDREVALKLLSPELADSEEYRRRFSREASALARLDSPHIITVYEAGEHDGWLYFATQLVTGGDLSALLARSGALSVDAALAVIAQIADGLVAAHAAGILHRDIKPSNVLVRVDGEQITGYLCDFGIALDEGNQHTKTTGVIGTLGYMAPERHRGEPASVGSDVYAMGCLLWAALTGDAPYVGTDWAVATAHMQNPVPQLAAADPQAAAVNALLLRAMAKDPAQRFPTARDLAAALAQARAVRATPPPPPPVSEATVRKPPAVPPPPRPDTQPTVVGGSGPRPPSFPPLGPPKAPFPPRVPGDGSKPSSQRGVLIASAVALVIVLVVGGVVLATTVFSGKDPAAKKDADTKAVSNPVCGVSIGVMDSFTGDLASLGAETRAGAGLAVDEYNAKHPTCRVGIAAYDTKSSVDVAGNLLPRVVAQTEMIGLVAPLFSGQMLAVGADLAQADLPMISAGATLANLSTEGWSTFHRILPSDAALLRAGADHLTGDLGDTRVYLIADSSEFGTSSAAAATEALGSKQTGSDVVTSTGSDLTVARADEIVDEVLGSNSDAVIFTGYTTDAATLVKRLRAGGFSGHYLVGEGSFDTNYPSAAGASGEGTIALSSTGVVPADFNAKITARGGTAPAPYAETAYDAANVLLAGIDAGNGTRAELEAWVDSYRGTGLSQKIAFTAKGELVDPDVWYATVESGKFTATRLLSGG